jgi:hypothetical protein
MLILAPAIGRQPKSQLRWSNELGDLRGLRPQWLLAGCGALQAVYWNRVCAPSPPLWAGSQNNHKCRWLIPLNSHPFPKLPLGGRRGSSESTRCKKVIPGNMQQIGLPKEKMRELRGGLGRETSNLRISTIFS